MSIAFRRGVLPERPKLKDTSLETSREESEESQEKLIEKRNNILNELFKTEATYVEYLQVVITIFYRPIINAQSGPAHIPNDKAKQIFQNIEKLHDINAAMLKKLAARKAQASGDLTTGCYIDILKETFAQVSNF